MQHIDPDTLAAFSEQALCDHERNVVLDHLAACESCRDWLRAHARALTARQTRTRRFDIGIAGAALAAMLVVALGLSKFSGTTSREVKSKELVPAIAKQAVSRPLEPLNRRRSHQASIWNHPRFQLALSQQSSQLPYPLVSTRLARLDCVPANMYAASHDTIAIQTALGERRIALNTLIGAGGRIRE